MAHRRWLIFLPAAVIALVSPAQADTFTENFDDQSYDLSVQFGQGVNWCNQYSDQYGTEGPSLCVFGPQSPTVFTFPVPVQGFQFVAGAKNGDAEITVTYTDGTTEGKPIDGSCCETNVSVSATSGKSIAAFSLPAELDLWLLDSLSWTGGSPTTTSTTVEPTTTTESTTTTVPPTTTSSSSTTEPVPPPVLQATEETVAPSTTFPETTVPETTTTVIQVTTTVAPTTTLAPTTTIETSTTVAPDTTLAAPVSVETAPPVVDTDVPTTPPLDASYEEKEEFEAQVNIYSGEYEEYVPAGSTITVAQRRTVVAATAVLIMFAPPPSRMRRK
jgi:hypothetical protein